MIKNFLFVNFMFISLFNAFILFYFSCSSRTAWTRLICCPSKNWPIWKDTQRKKPTFCTQTYNKNCSWMIRPTASWSTSTRITSTPCLLAALRFTTTTSMTCWTSLVIRRPLHRLRLIIIIMGPMEAIVVQQIPDQSKQFYLFFI